MVIISVLTSPLTLVYFGIEWFGLIFVLEGHILLFHGVSLSIESRMLSFSNDTFLLQLPILCLILMYGAVNGLTCKLLFCIFHKNCFRCLYYLLQVFYGKESQYSLDWSVILNTSRAWGSTYPNSVAALGVWHICLFFLNCHQNDMTSKQNSCSLVLPILKYYCLHWACKPFQSTTMDLRDSYHYLASPTNVY